MWAVMCKLCRGLSSSERGSERVCVSVLPQELLLRIFRFLGPEDLCRCGQVCSVWAQVAKTGSLWRHLYPVRWARGALHLSALLLNISKCRETWGYKRATLKPAWKLGPTLLWYCEKNVGVCFCSLVLIVKSESCALHNESRWSTRVQHHKNK